MIDCATFYVCCSDRRLSSVSYAGWEVPVVYTQFLSTRTATKYTVTVIYGPLDSTARKNAHSHLIALEDLDALHSILTRIEPNHNYSTSEITLPWSIGKLELKFRKKFQFPHPAAINNFSDLFFNKKVSKEASALFGWSGMSSFSIKKANKLGLKTFVFRSSPHILEHLRQIQQEIKKYHSDESSGVGETLNTWKECYEYNEADKIVSQSNYTLNTFRKQGISDNKLIKIPLDAGIDVLDEYFEVDRKVDQSQPFTVCTATTVDLNRGVHYLLNAWGKFAEDKQNIKLQIAGTRKKSFPDYIYSKFEKRSDVEFLGYIDDVKRLYANADVFVLVSLADGGPNGPLEAMASGLPVIVSENMGAKEVVEDDTGFIVPVRDTDAIVERLNYLYDNPDSIRQMGVNARQHMRNINGRQREGMKDFYRKHVA